MPVLGGDSQRSRPKRSNSGDGSGDSGRARTPDFFEEKLSELRRKLGWTQADLGQFFGVSRLSAHRWEARGVGETEPRKAALRVVATALERSPAPGHTVGQALLGAGVVGTMTASVHRSERLGAGDWRGPAGWETAFRVRERLGWTQVEFARFMGVTHSVPAVWEDEDEGGRFGEAVRAALLTLDLVSDPRKEDYPLPETPLEELRAEGLNAFYREVAELRIGGPESPPSAAG